MRSERGVALLSVLWIIMIISILSLTLAASVRMEIGAESDSLDSERAFFMAKGAVESLFMLFQQDSEIPKTGPFVRDVNGDFVFHLETGDARVRFESGAGLINLNQATDKLLASMFDSVGVDQDLRNHLVDSILDWRDTDDIPHLYGAEINDYVQKPGQRLPRNGPFTSIDELLEVKYMTPQIFNGSIALDTATGQYRRLPGVRELITVDSDSEKIEINEATPEVLLALRLTSDQVQHLVTEREKKRFDSLDDVSKRVPDIQRSAALDYLTVADSVPTALSAQATVRSSGISRSVRMVFKREDRLQVLRQQPLLYRTVTDIKFAHWQF